MFKSTKSATANAMVTTKASCAASMAASVLVINALSIQLGVFPYIPYFPYFHYLHMHYYRK